jgi:glycosyltransferase involved in cell wall biosynthesis
MSIILNSSTILDSEENRLISDWEVDRNKKTILMPGRLTAWKGQETFIEALNLVNKELGYESFNASYFG